jgi:uncharacterized membrane protein YecN with MAPEG domain
MSVNSAWLIWIFVAFILTALGIVPVSYMTDSYSTRTANGIRLCYVYYIVTAIWILPVVLRAFAVVVAE